MTLKKIMILNGQYLPGYKGGGPIQSCVNMIENLSDRFDFYVVCADRDYKQNQPYDDIKIDQWNRFGPANVYYMSPGQQSLKGFEKVMNEIDYDILYLNGFFSPIFTLRPLLLHKLGRLKNTKVILTPRGDFTGGCENKKVKKYIYIYLMKIAGLYRNLQWQATSDIERRDILKKFPRAEICTVPNLPAKYVEKVVNIKKEAGELRLVFISRIFPKKNLKYALEVLQEVKDGNILFDIYGPMEDTAYWAECEKVIDRLPPGVKVKYCGEVPHDQIPCIFEQYHAFFFPTLGENYGHVIVEAMMNNCLCILSKGVTPWDDYIERLGIGAMLYDKKEFVETIRGLLGADQKEFNRMVLVNNQYIAEKLNPDKDIEGYIRMFS